MWPLSTSAAGGATEVSTGHGGVTDSHGRCGVFGCYFQPIPHGRGREELNSLADVVRSQQGSLRGLTPRYFTGHPTRGSLCDVIQV